jgi:hypothetical protein
LAARVLAVGITDAGLLVTGILAAGILVARTLAAGIKVAGILAGGILAAGILAARISAAGILAAGILAQREIYVHHASLRYVVRSRRILVMSFGAFDFVQPKALRTRSKDGGSVPLYANVGGKVDISRKGFL